MAWGIFKRKLVMNDYKMVKNYVHKFDIGVPIEYDELTRCGRSIKDVKFAETEAKNVTCPMCIKNSVDVFGYKGG